MKRNIYLIVCLAVLAPCFSLAQVYAATTKKVVRSKRAGRRVVYRSHYSGSRSEFSRPSFKVNSGSGEFSRPSFDLNKNKGEFSQKSHTSYSGSGEFSKPSFSVNSNSGQFSKPSFSLNFFR